MRRLALVMSLVSVCGGRASGEFWPEQERPERAKPLAIDAGPHELAMATLGRPQAALHATQLAFERSQVHQRPQAPQFSLWTLEYQRNLNPVQFDRLHSLAGPVIGEITRFQAGLIPPSNSRVNELLARRALNPARFDRYNPGLGRLLAIDLQWHAARWAPLNGFLPNTPRINDLRWRRSLNPRRFDHNNPTLGRLLAEDELLRKGLVFPSPPFFVHFPVLGPGPGQGKGPPPIGPPVGPPLGPPYGPPPHVPPHGPPAWGGPQVPEPSSLLLLSLGCLCLIGCRFLTEMPAGRLSLLVMLCEPNCNFRP